MPNTTPTAELNLGIIHKALQFGKEDYMIRLLGVDSGTWDGREHNFFIYDIVTRGRGYTLTRAWKISCN